MAALFRQGSTLEKIDSVWKLTLEHGTGLATFAVSATFFMARTVLLCKSRVAQIHAIYKGLMEVMTRLNILPANARSFVAGGVAGRLIFARYSAVNYQIVLYLLSRVAVGIVTRASRRGIKPFCSCRFKAVYPHLATFCWALVMHLFEHDQAVLHPSLTASMQFIYKDRHSWKEFRQLLPAKQAAGIVAAYVAYTVTCSIAGVSRPPRPPPRCAASSVT
eukprot:6312-Heterococcus_DN1.PRE.3